MLDIVQRCWKGRACRWAGLERDVGLGSRVPTGNQLQMDPLKDALKVAPKCNLAPTTVSRRLPAMKDTGLASYQHEPHRSEFFVHFCH